MKKLRWGVLGTAKINQKIFPYLRSSPVSDIFAVASRSDKKAKNYALENEIPKYFGSYDDLVAGSDVDVVYNSLPNHLHFEWTKKALLAGKHVLCEKPMTLRYREACELHDLAKNKDLILSEAYMFRYHAQTQKIKEVANNPIYGGIKQLRTNFNSVLPEGDNIRLHPETGGGVLWDIGCYLVHLSQFLVDKNVIGVQALRKSKLDKVDIHFLGVIYFESDITAQLSCSFSGPRFEVLEIETAKGWIAVPKPYKPTTHETFVVSHNRVQEDIQVKDDKDPYLREIEYFETLILEKAQPILDVAESCKIVRILEAFQRSYDDNRFVDLEEIRCG